MGGVDTVSQLRLCAHSACIIPSSALYSSQTSGATNRRRPSTCTSYTVASQLNCNAEPSDISRKPSPYLPNTLQGKHMSHLHRGPRNGDPTRVYWSLSPRKDPTSWTLRELLDVLPSRRSLNTPEQHAICIIEDITIEWMNRITDYMGLDPAFFANHFDQSWDTQSHPWHWTAGSARHDIQISEESQRWRSLDGKYSLPGQSKTRISYHRPREMLCKDELYHLPAAAC